MFCVTGGIALHIEKKTLRNVFIGVISCIVLYWILHDTDRVKTAYGVVKGVLSPFVLGAGLAFILNVPMRAIERWFKAVPNLKVRRLIAVLLPLLAVLLVLTLVYVLLVPQLISSAKSFIPKLEKVPSLINDLTNRYPQIFG